MGRSGLAGGSPSWVSLLLVAVLAGLVIGPLADHHFAEREAGHRHLVVNGSSLVGHHHEYEIPHSHDGKASKDASGALAALTDAIGQATPTFVLTGLIFFLALVGLMRSAAVGRTRATPSPLFGPPWRPPRA